MSWQEDVDRRFIISYYLADETSSVYEIPVANSGIVGGAVIFGCAIIGGSPTGHSLANNSAIAQYLPFFNDGNPFEAKISMAPSATEPPSLV